jgi:hypothetical protein
MKILIVILCILSFQNCINEKIGNFREISLSPVINKTVMSDVVVKGEHCRVHNLFTGYAYPHIDLAVDDAVSKVPGSIGLKDVKVDHYINVWLLPIYCFRVEGIAVK